jgi:hypothetical protein
MRADHRSEYGYLGRRHVPRCLQTIGSRPTRLKDGSFAFPRMSQSPVRSERDLVPNDPERAVATAWAQTLTCVQG